MRYIFLFVAIHSFADVNDELIKHIERVERSSTSGDGGRAVGVLQIHKGVILDVNRVYHTSYKPHHRYSRKASYEMCRLYLSHYGRVYKKSTGKEPTDSVLVRIWNGGPKGYLKQGTLDYEKLYRSGQRNLRPLQ